MIHEDAICINNYNLQRYRRKKRKYRLILGLREFIQKPLLNLGCISLLVVAVLSNVYLQKFICKLEIPEVLTPIYKYTFSVALIVIYVVIVLGILLGIAEIKARDDEADIIEAFREYRVDKMPPILIFKKKDKKNIYIRKFYSFIPVEKWNEKIKDIETCLNVKVIGEIENGKIGRIVILKTFDGKKRKDKEELYDEEF